MYIHGFMGTETSFHSFPAHVHGLLSNTLAESHIVHTKIYPQYASRRNISVARDDFSNWLYPHESETTDVILAGHSLGGILGAEVVLLPSHTHGSREALQHRILGLIAFDTPFLGMHPMIVSTGIASLFRGAPEPSEENVDSTPPPISFDMATGDPNYNPAYPNDVKLPVRKNKWERAWYFWNKHGGDLRKATQSYVKSHLEFGGCLADFNGLRKRYDAVRSLEDVDELNSPTGIDGKLHHRVRFVNYYTASSGRIKEEAAVIAKGSLSTDTVMDSLQSNSSSDVSSTLTTESTPKISKEEDRHDDLADVLEELSIEGEEESLVPMNDVEPTPFEDETDTVNVSLTSTTTLNFEDLPPLPDQPEEPAPLDETRYADPDVLKLAQKDKARQMKAFERAKKDREKAVRDREKIIEKRKRQAEKERQKQEDLATQEALDIQKKSEERQSTLNPEDQDRVIRSEENANPSKTTKPLKDRKFCVLPAKDQNGKRDATWVRVYMEGMDEVVAHTSLFNVSKTYAKLVGDTVERIEEWVREDASVRVIRLEQG